MAVVDTDHCEACRFTECVKVCPVACFPTDETMLYIDSSTCIDCCACIPACPVQAIYLEDDLPAYKVQWLELNRERSAVLPLITKSDEPLPTAPAKRAALGF